MANYDRGEDFGGYVKNKALQSLAFLYLLRLIDITSYLPLGNKTAHGTMSFLDDFGLFYKKWFPS